MDSGIDPVQSGTWYGFKIPVMQVTLLNGLPQLLRQHERLWTPNDLPCQR